jgi:hypothetical protein
MLNLWESHAHYRGACASSAINTAHMLVALLLRRSRWVDFCAEEPLEAHSEYGKLCLLEPFKGTCWLRVVGSEVGRRKSMVFKWLRQENCFSCLHRPTVWWCRTPSCSDADLLPAPGFLLCFRCSPPARGTLEHRKAGNKLRVTESSLSGWTQVVMPPLTFSGAQLQWLC